MYVREFPQPARGSLGRYIPLWVGEHLVTDHEFFDRSRTQQRRIERHVHLPLGMRTVGGRLVYPGRIRERTFEHIIVPDGYVFHGIGKTVAFGAVKFRQDGTNPAGNLVVVRKCVSLSAV